MTNTAMHSAESTLFQRLEAGQLAQLTSKDDLTIAMVPLVCALTRAPPAAALSAQLLAAPPTPAVPASHSATGCAVQRPLPRAMDGPLDIHTAAHVFQLLARYPQANRANKYLELDVSGIWEQVKRQSRYSLTTLTEAEKSEHDAIQFERGDQETRVKLVLTELRQLARGMRRRHSKEKDRPLAPSSAANTPVPPARSAAFARTNSHQHASVAYGGATSASASAAGSPVAPPAPSFQSDLLTHPLFAGELDTILPVLYLRARNSAPGSSGLTDEEDEEAAEALGEGEDAGTGPVRRFQLPPDVDTDSDERMGVGQDADSQGQESAASLFMPLRDLVIVLLHQGPAHGTRLLTLLAYAKPRHLASLLDVCLELLRHQLVHLYERMHSLSMSLPGVMHNSSQLSSAALHLWQQAYAGVHSAPLTTLHAVVLALASLAPSQVGLYVRVRVAAMMEELRLSPPTLSLPPAPAPPPSVSVTAPSAAPAAPTAAAAAAPPPSPSPANTSTPGRNRGAPLPAPVHVSSASMPRSSTPLNGVSAGASSIPASSFVTPVFISALLQHCWAPLSHYLPRLVLALTQSVVRDESVFLSSQFARLNSPFWIKSADAGAASSSSSSLSGEKHAAHWIIEFVRDHKMADEYSDHVSAAQQAAASAAAAAAAAAAVAAHAASVKARAAAEAAEPRGKRKNSESRARDRERTKAAALQQQQQQQQLQPPQQPQSKSASGSSRAPAPNVSPSLSSHKASSSLAQSIPSLAAQSPQKNAHTHSSPTLQPNQAGRELLFTPLHKNKTGAHTQAQSGAHHYAPLTVNLTSGPAAAAAAMQVFRSGAVDVLRTKLFARMQHAASEYESRLPHHAGLAAPLRESTAVRSSLASVLSELLRLVKLYCQLQLYCNWQMRPRELEQIHHLVPPAAHAATCVEHISCSSTLLALLVQLHQFVLALLCICPAATLHVPLSSPQWSQTLATLQRSKAWMGAMQAAQVRVSCSGTPAANALASMLDSRVYGCDNLLLQLGISAQQIKASELSFLLRTMLRLPLHFKPALLLPHTASAHLKEMQHALLQAHVWPKFQVIDVLFSFECAKSGQVDRTSSGSGIPAIFERDSRGMVVLRSHSPLLVASLSAKISNAFHLLRPTPTALHSLVPRPYLEYTVGFFFSRLLRLARRDDGGSVYGHADAAQETSASPFGSDHPLLSHNAILPLLESVAQFDLSAAITEQQQSYAHSGAQGAKPATFKRDQRVIKEEEMRELLELHLTPARTHSDTGAKGSDSSSFPCVSQLSNPIGLLLVVYYFLYYNSLAFAVSWKVIPNVPHPPTAAETEESANGRSVSGVGGGGGGKDAEAGGGGNNVTLSAPVPPFAPVFAQNVCSASAISPYPPSLLERVPLRGLLEYLKHLRLTLLRRSFSSSSPPSSAEDPSASNASALYAHLHRLLTKHFPEALIGFDAASCSEDRGDDANALVADLQRRGVDLRPEGSMVALGLPLPIANPAAATVKLEGAPSSDLLPSSAEFVRIAQGAVSSPIDESPLLHALQRLQHRIQEQEDLASAAASPHSMSLFAELFLLHVLRPMYRRRSRASPALRSAVTELWLRVYSSSLSSSKLVHRTMLCMLDDGAEDADPSEEGTEQSWARLESWLPYEEWLIDPYRVVAAAPLHLLSQAHLLRPFLACVFHALVASSSFFALLSKSEYVSAQVVRQARFQSAHAAWTRAAKLMAPPPNPNERGRGVGVGGGGSQKEIDPMLLAVHSLVDKAAHALYAAPSTDPKQPAGAAAAPVTKKEIANAGLSVGTPSPKDGAVTSADADGKALKRCKTDAGAAGASAGVDAAGTVKREDAAARMQMDTNGEKPPSSSSLGAPGTAPAPAVSTATAPRPSPFPFLVSDRVLTAGEQQVFSAEFVLAPPPASASASGGAVDIGSASVTTPTLRTFAYLLTTRAAVVQSLLSHAAQLVRSTDSDKSKRTNGVDESESSECVSAIFAFLSLLLTASVPASSTSPSSLLLLLHVQSYPVELLPHFVAHFHAQMRILLHEGPLLQRIRAGVGDADADTKAQTERAHFLQQLMQLKVDGKLA